MASNKVFIERSLINSKAFTSLKNHSPKVLLKFRTKCRWTPRKNKRDSFFIANNGEIVFTYKEANMWGHLSDHQFVNAIDDLIEKGFLRITRQGAGDKDVSLYELTDNWKKYGTDEFVPNPPRRKRGDKKPIGGPK